MLNLYRERILVVPRLCLAPVGQQLQRHLLFAGLLALAKTSRNSTTTAAGTTTAPALGRSSFVSALRPTLVRVRVRVRVGVRVRVRIRWPEGPHPQPKRQQPQPRGGLPPQAKRRAPAPPKGPR